ncbi:hypothetical protein OIU77_015253 [Salix suchowensis]|uniref:PWI domain-containing protein n=1 Tax=Salix suchowensis TaxID=1278906 RepID=A0ABQ8ZSR9_9ROSI|nr:hypothetical protein OIU77_015253 [Salix suchowensis]
MRISNVAPREEKPDVERERSRHSHDRSSLRDRDHNEDRMNRNRDDNKEKVPDRDRDRDRNRDHGPDKVKTPDKQKLLDAKQLIDMIPKTKEELFLYEINWAVYDKVSQMLEMLQVILDDEAEMFVLKMWRMLIFEIKKVETGLSLRSKS